MHCKDILTEVRRTARAHLSGVQQFQPTRGLRSPSALRVTTLPNKPTADSRCNASEVLLLLTMLGADEWLPLFSL